MTDSISPGSAGSTQLQPSETAAQGRLTTHRLLTLQFARAYMTRPLQLLHKRWEQLQIDVRCALHAAEPQRIRHYLLGGAKLARLGVFDDVGVQLHMTRTLLKTARDPELPGFWRSACLECVSHPLQRLRTLLELRDPCTAHAIEQAVWSGQHRIPVPCKEQSLGL